MAPNQLLILGVSGPELGAEEVDRCRAIQPGGYLLGSHNITGIEQTRHLTDSLRSLSDTEPLLCLQSTEPLPWPAGLLGHAPPTPDQLRAAADPKIIMTAGWIAGRLLRLLGLNFHLSPDLDPGGTGWGLDDQQIINNAGIFNRYQRKQGILGCGLPFPGGPQCADLDLGELLRSPLLPFTALMPELDGILLSNTVFPKLDTCSPASASHRIITRLLRDQLGYKRLVLAENNDAASITAGADLIILHDGASAPEALASLDGLSGYILSDAIDRIESARRRFHQPTKLTAKNLDRLREDARDLIGRIETATSRSET